MTPEEKAKELVERFNNLVELNSEEWMNASNTGAKKGFFENSKKYALICVDEMKKSEIMLLDNICDNLNGKLVHETYKSILKNSLEVKQEIKNF